MKAAFTFRKFEDLGVTKYTGTLDFDQPLDPKDVQLRDALLESRRIFLNQRRHAVMAHPVSTYNRPLAIVHGTTQIVPAELHARQAVKRLTESNTEDAHLCARCGKRHLMEAVGTFFDADPAVVYVPIFVALCARCYRAVVTQR